MNLPRRYSWGRLGALIGALVTVPFVVWFGTFLSSLSLLAGAAVGWGIGYVTALISEEG